MKLRALPFTLIILLSMMGCYFPAGKYSSTLQSARTLDAKELETTFIGSIQSNSKNKEDAQWYIGMREAVTVMPEKIPLTFTPELGFLWSNDERVTSGSLAIGIIKRREK